MNQYIIEHIFKSEGGFVNHPSDPGKATNMGITMATLQAFRGKAVTVEDVKNLTKAEATAIYEKNYWNKMRLHLLTHPEIQLLLMDQGVNRGPITVVKQAQIVANSIGANLKVDGDLGEKTSTALNTLPRQKVCVEFTQYSQAAYNDICIRKPDQLVFLRGWTNRVQALQDLTLVNDMHDVFGDVILNPTPKPDTTEPIKSNLSAYQWAQNEHGTAEFAGSKHNPRILFYHDFTTLDAGTDEVAWCSSFLCAAFESCGMKSTDSAAARSWLKWGLSSTGKRGDVAVFWRVAKDSWQGHVGFVNMDYSEGDKYVSVLGGNQSNKVSVANQSAGQLLGFRKLG